MTREEFKRASAIMAKARKQRHGQYMVNTYDAMWPNVEFITGADYDCFYDNRLIEKFLDYLESQGCFK